MTVNKTRNNYSESVPVYESGLLLTVKEACQLLHVHSNTLRRWADKGLIRVYRIGPTGHRRFKAEDLAAFIVEEAKRLRADSTKPRKFPKRAKSAS
jgi:excisionase family DNA binding protein